MGADPETSPTRPDGIQLLIELERLFQSDPDIDEVAVLPATDNTRVNLAASVTVHLCGLSTFCVVVSIDADGLAGGEPVAGSPVDPLQSRIPSAFFLAEHKLAVALPAVEALYRAANEILQSYLFAIRTSASKNTDANEALRSVLCEASLPEDISIADTSGSECWPLMAARAIVLINGEHSTAWNVRKRWIRRLVTIPAASRLDRGQHLDAAAKSSTCGHLALRQVRLPPRKSDAIVTLTKRVCAFHCAGGARGAPSDCVTTACNTANISEHRQIAFACFAAQAVHSELRLVEAVLSVRPKSLAAWAHRRWVLRTAGSLAPPQ
eukprot:3499382-Pyramimonas_sp.AAC.1